MNPYGKFSLWYGSPGSRAASQRGTDMVLVSGASEENLLMAASFVARGSSVAITSGTTGHRILLQGAA